jgi:hypothetical protein
MPRPRHKLGFRNQTVPQKISICSRFIRAMWKQPEATRQTVRLDAREEELTAATAATALVENLRKQLRTAVTDRNKKVGALCLGTTISSVAYSSLSSTESDLRKGGLDIIRRGKPSVRPAVPAKFRSRPTRREGAVSLRWTRPLRRCSFVVEISTNPGNSGSWKHCLNCVTTHCVIEGLTPGVRYWFRVHALNRQGHGPSPQPLPVRAA